MVVIARLFWNDHGLSAGETCTRYNNKEAFCRRNGEEGRVTTKIPFFGFARSRLTVFSKNPWYLPTFVARLTSHQSQTNGQHSRKTVLISLLGSYSE